jgi:hypothetical protein
MIKSGRKIPHHGSKDMKEGFETVLRVLRRLLNFS